MIDTLHDKQLSQVSNFIAASMGLYFPRSRWHDLEQNLKLASKQFGYSDFTKFLQWLLSSNLTQEQVEILASELTISETYFWREPKVFEALLDQILPEFIHSRITKDRHLRLWSAGCATGEEPYSIAIALCKAIPIIKDWNISLLATDINPHILRRAAAGLYGNWSFRNSPPGFKEEYFTRKSDGKFEILPHIRGMVNFAYLNLATDSFPATINGTNAIDIIFCRNVLMYFDTSHARIIGQHFYKCLVERGWLIVSSSELSQNTFPQFIPTNFTGAIAYRKSSEIPKQITMPFNEKTISLLKKQAKPLIFPEIKLVSLQPQSKIQQPIEGSIAESSKPADETVNQSEVLQSVRELANSGNLDEAWAACNDAINSNKFNSGLLYLGATILQELKRENDAITLLKRALYLDPAFLMAYFSLGNLALHQGNTKNAKKNFQNVQDLLSHYEVDDILPDAEGLTAGRLCEIIRATLQIGEVTL